MVNLSAILSANILVVDDLEANAQLLTRMLVSAGYISVASTTNSLEVCELHLKHRYDLILLDLEMPGMDGFQVMEGLRAIEPDGYLPVLVLTAHPDYKLRALRSGAKDFITTPFALAEVLTRVRNMLEVRLLHKELQHNNDALEQRVHERTSELLKAENKVRGLNRVYAVLSGINSLIVRVRDRQELFDGACRIAVEQGGFGIAWIGTLDPTSSAITPIAGAGIEKDSQVFLSVGSARSDIPEGQSEVGRAVREKRVVFCNDIAADADIGSERRKEAIRRGYRSTVALPLIMDGKAVGNLSLLTKEHGFFTEEELKLLGELAGDISFALEHLAKEEKLAYLALYDALTGAPNRNLIRDRLAQQIGAATREEEQLAVILLDIERFNTINDTFGRQAGDELLKQIAARCSSFAADPTLFARIVGDQFAVVIPDVKSKEDVARVVEQRNREILDPPYHVGEMELRVAAKFGIAVFPGDGVEADTLLKNAEAALKRAKATGERYLLYTQQMTERVGGQLSLENKLRQALEKKQFVLHYQPKVDLRTRRIMGVEALLRWQSPDLGLVPPLRFIPLLEETGAILEVGAWTLRRAVLDHRQWLEQDLAAPRVAVNVSAVQLRHRDFVNVVKEALQQCFDPPALDIEITESVMMGDIGTVADRLQAIRNLGLQVSIDDFGTGYSSLGYLTKLPVDSLKVDRSFIATMMDDPDALTLVSTIIALAHSLRLKVCAEGVETEEQAKTLRLLRCDEMQGYLISRPVPESELKRMLDARRAS